MIQAAILALALTGAPTVTLKGKVTVHKPDGSTAGDASEVVVFISDVSEPVKGAKVTIQQVNRQFEPRVVAVAQGTQVDFPNHDNLEHNVFSNTPGAKFDLGRQTKGGGGSWVATSSTMVEVFCNVHPEMVAYVVVAPSKLFAVTGKDGSFELKDVPAGKHKLTVWERFARPKVKQLEIDAAEGAAPLAISVDEHATADDPHKNKYDTNYPKSW